MPRAADKHQQLALVDNRLRAWKLRVDGWPVDDIATELSVSTATVYKWLRDKMTELEAEETATAEQYRQQEIARLDEVIRSQVERMRDKQNARSSDAANAVTRAVELKAKLLGIEQATRLDITAVSANLTIADMLRYATMFDNAELPSASIEEVDSSEE